VRGKSGEIRYREEMNEKRETNVESKRAYIRSQLLHTTNLILSLAVFDPFFLSLSHID
jgi:hypothetical protein